MMVGKQAFEENQRRALRQKVDQTKPDQTVSDSAEASTPVLEPVHYARLEKALDKGDEIECRRAADGFGTRIVKIYDSLDKANLAVFGYGRTAEEALADASLKDPDDKSRNSEIPGRFYVGSKEFPRSARTPFDQYFEGDSRAIIRRFLETDPVKIIFMGMAQPFEGPNLQQALDAVPAPYSKK